LASCVSLKFAVTQGACPSTMARSGCPACTSWPISTFFFATMPEAGAVITA